MTRPRVAYRHGPPYLGLEIWIRDSHQIAISPLEYDQTGYGVVSFGRSIVEELDEDKGIDRTAPRLATIHSYSNPSAPALEQSFCVMEAYRCNTGESLPFRSGQKRHR